VGPSPLIYDLPVIVYPNQQRYIQGEALKIREKKLEVAIQ